MKSQEVVEAPSFSLREAIMKSRDHHVTTKSDPPKFTSYRKVNRAGSVFNRVTAPGQKPQTGSPVIEEIQSGETEDKTLTKDPLGPYGRLYNGYFELETYEPCAKSLQQKERNAKNAQEDKEFDEKWNKTPSPPRKEIKDTAQPGKETLSDSVVPTLSIPANH